MKLEVVENKKILVNSTRKNFELHPLWLRERAKNENLVDKNNNQRLYDPSQLNKNLKIKKASVNNGHLNIEFTDGIKFKYQVNELLYELNKKEPIEKIFLWDSKLKKSLWQHIRKTFLKPRKCLIYFKNFINTASLFSRMYQSKITIF